MIYLDSSVALATLFAERRSPPPSLWSELLISSRLLEYEVTVRAHAHQVGAHHLEAVRKLIDGVDLLELAPDILSRALRPFPVAVRSLDALHLATMEFLRAEGHSFELASYDTRLAAAAAALGFPLARV